MAPARACASARSRKPEKSPPLPPRRTIQKGNESLSNPYATQKNPAVIDDDAPAYFDTTKLSLKLRPAIKYGIDALLIVVPLLGMTYFLFDPEAFNAFTAWLMGVL